MIINTLLITDIILVAYAFFLIVDGLLSLKSNNKENRITNLFIGILILGGVWLSA